MRGLLALTLLLGAPACDGEVCVVLPGFGDRSSYDELARSQAERLVRSEAALISALADENVRSIVVAKDFTLTRTISLHRSGVQLSAVGGSILFVKDGVTPAFDVPAGVERITLRDLDVRGPSLTEFADVLLSLDRGADNSRVEGVRFYGVSLVEADGSGTTLDLIIAGNHGYGDTGAGADEWIDLVCSRSLIAHNTLFEPNGGITLATGNANRIIGNTLGGADITISSGGKNAIVGNAMENGAITTSASDGKNAVSGNTSYGALTLHVDDEETANTAA